MYRYHTLLFAILLVSCRDSHTTEIELKHVRSFSQIIVYVYFHDRGVSGKQILLLETADTVLTDSNGLARFSVPSGRYTIRAFDIGVPGPGLPSIDIRIIMRPGDSTKVDIFDCEGCV